MNYYYHYPFISLSFILLIKYCKKKDGEKKKGFKETKQIKQEKIMPIYIIRFLFLLLIFILCNVNDIVKVGTQSISFNIAYNIARI